MSQVIMFARMDSEDIHVGKCTHAQARILEKKGHGQIEDGKLRLNIRPVHLMAAENQRVIGDPDPNVSKAELERRIKWLQSLMAPIALMESSSEQGILILRERWKHTLMVGSSRRLRKKVAPTAEEFSFFEDELRGIFRSEAEVGGEASLSEGELWFEDMSEHQLSHALELIGCPSNYKASAPTQDVREDPVYKKLLKELLEEGIVVL